MRKPKLDPDYGSAPSRRLFFIFLELKKLSARKLITLMGFLGSSSFKIMESEQEIRKPHSSNSPQWKLNRIFTQMILHRLRYHICRIACQKIRASREKENTSSYQGDKVMIPQCTTWKVQTYRTSLRWVIWNCSGSRRSNTVAFEDNF